jgi:hypothetical protein
MEDSTQTITREQFILLCGFSKGATQGKGRVAFLLELNYQVRHFLYLRPINTSNELGSGEAGDLFRQDIIRLIAERGNDPFDAAAEMDRCVITPVGQREDDE